MAPDMTEEEVFEELEKTKYGTVRNTRDNCTKVFRHDPLLREALRLNMLSGRISVVKDLGWERSGDAVTNADIRRIHLYVEQTYGLTSEKLIDEALMLVADENRYHPVRDRLNRLVWDGQERIRYALQHFLGADASDYTYEALRLFMLAAVKRVFRPGAKFDYMLCLIGGQGIGKSTFLRFLAMQDEWFTDDVKNLESDRVYEKLQGHWIVELSEMIAAINAKTTEAIKSFLSRDKETYRTVYERFPEDRPRQCVIAGTTNKMAFLPGDRSGNRRFFPVCCEKEKAEVFILDDIASSRNYIDQMWAEAMVIYRSGKYSLKPSKKMEQEVMERQIPYTPEDTDAGLILAFMEDTRENMVCSKMLFREALGNETSQPQRWQTNDICETVNQLIRDGRLKGWRPLPKEQRIRGYGVQRGWERIPDCNEP